MSTSLSSSGSSSPVSPFRLGLNSETDYVYEAEYSSEENKIPITAFPLLNPYKAFVKPSKSVKKFIKHAFQKEAQQAREIVLASKMEQHLVPATNMEQLIPIKLEGAFVRNWMMNKFTHLHYGAVKLALTFHGRKGLPVVTRIALLDTRFKEYQQACIATVQTTLNAGTVFITLYPNFNIPLRDPNITNNLKVQIQITGAPQKSNSFAATLHYQMAYRVQNHCMDLCLPRDSNEAILLQIDSHQTPSYTHIPRQIPKAELVKLLPESWITNYEKSQEENEPVHSTQPSYSR